MSEPTDHTIRLLQELHPKMDSMSERMGDLTRVTFETREEMRLMRGEMHGLKGTHLHLYERQDRLEDRMLRLERRLELRDD